MHMPGTDVQPQQRNWSNGTKEPDQLWSYTDRTWWVDGAYKGLKSQECYSWMDIEAVSDLARR